MAHCFRVEDKTWLEHLEVWGLAKLHETMTQFPKFHRANACLVSLGF